MTTTANKLKVLILEPYYGGSHKSFIENLLKLPFDFEALTLPARKWKWRMRLSAPYFAEKLHKTGKRFDRIICSTFVDVAALRGMAPEWVRGAPLLTYFHENQFAYPVQVESERDFHFALTNMTTALSSDSLAFNSRYNLTSFIDGINDLLRHSTDMKLKGAAEAIKEKSRVLPLGVDFTAIDEAEEPRRGEGPPVVLWNHRWEHDKNPSLFFETLFKLDKEVDFSLVVLGESFERQPDVFDKAREKLEHRILHFGFVESAGDYARWLRHGDIAVSTTTHEFFGISVLEAVRAGARPLLPRRLSYPEMFPDEFLYDDETFTQRLKEEILKGKRLSREESLSLTGPYSWEALAPAFESWIINAHN